MPRPQVCRRIVRRRVGLELSSLDAYRRRLEADADEWLSLDRFCRDRAVFDSLVREGLPALARRATAEGRSTLTA